MTHTLDMEIFSVGTWNGDPYTAADLEEIARNFARLRNEIKPPLKLGHDPGQRVAEASLTGQQDGDPALGWVSALRVAGDKLIATCTDLPELVWQAIRAKRYRRVSVEMYTRLEHGGAHIGKALKAVALLGADLPAVTNLQDLTAYLTDGGWQTGPVLTFTSPLRTPDLSLEETPMAEPTGAPQTDAPQAELEAELAELRAFKARQETQAQESTRRRTEEAYRSQRQAALAVCEGHVRAGTLAPSLRDRVARELDAQARHFTVLDGLRVPWSLCEALLAQDAALPAGELAFAAADPAGDGDGDPSARLAALAQRKMVELNLGYSQAAHYVLKTNPGLARAYRDYTLNPQTGG